MVFPPLGNGPYRLLRAFSGRAVDAFAKSCAAPEAAQRARLAAVDGRLLTGVGRRMHGADARFRATAARLDSLSPLAVLGRGYAVCWNADRSAIVRDASTVESGASMMP